jgi:Zinc-binding loop region of homing endonuclease
MRVDPTNPFWDWVAVAGPGECWLWQGSVRRRGGYGSTGGPLLAHQQSFLLSYGYVAEEVSHTCHTPACCNPAHLTDETHAQNMERSRLAGRFANNGTYPRQ